MTKEEIIKIIDQNKDVLTSENYERILKNVDVFTAEEKEKIAAYLSMAQEMIEVNHKMMKAQNDLYQRTGNKLKDIDEKMLKDTKEVLQKAEASEETEASEEAEKLISNL
ncbi:hypothetical protein KKA33_03015 [Patescibacteria group bacterium]|nr:hypothetical protein [Patescibacteria group bacterium]